MDLGIKFSGSISVQINPTLLEATITLEKNGQEHWNSEKLWRFLASQGVKEGFNKKDLEFQIDQFINSAQKTTSFVFARGTLPVPPTPEEVEWRDFVVPEDLKPLAERLLKKYPNPAVFRIRKEKVEVVKSTEPKSSGMFGGKKPEVKKETEVREVREHVVVNPKFLAVGYFEANQTVGTVFPPKPGKPGRDLQGQAVPPPPMPPSEFYLSEGIEKTLEGYVVRSSGFVRRGQNWLDLIPYQAHRFEIRYTEDKTGAFLDFYPGSVDAPHVGADEILERLERDGFNTEKAFGKGKIESLIRESLASNRPILNQPLTEDSDASFRVEISTDRLTATLSVIKQSGKGKPLNLEALTKALQDLKIRSLNVNEVVKNVKEFLKSNQLSLDNLIIARGRLPGRDADRVLDFRIDFWEPEQWQRTLQRIMLNPRLLENVPGLKEFPFERVQKVTAVPQNTVVAVLAPGQGLSGAPGQDIFGNPIPPYPGNDPQIRFWGNIRRAGDNVVAFEDGLVQIAEEEGVYLVRLLPYRDARVEVFHAPDHMSARVNLYQSIGAGEPLTTTLVMDALRQDQVLEGIDQDAIARALDLARKTGKAEGIEVARGRKPGSSLETRLELKIETKRTPTGALAGSVQAGQEFAVYKPVGEACEDGIDIMGNVIPCVQDEAQDLNLGQHITMKSLSEDGKVALVAEKSGEIVLWKNKLELKDKLVLHHGATKDKKVYRFAGEILVEGNVDSGVAVYAGGDIKVRGDVGASLLSGSNVIVAGKVTGDGKAVLSSKKHLSVTVAEKAHLLSVGDTIVQQSALACQFKCNSRIVQKSPNGTIVGGKIKSKFGLDVVNLGNPSRKETLISFGQDYLVEDQINVEEKEIEKVRQAIVAMDRLMLKYNSPAYRKELDAVRKKKVVLMKLLEKRGRKLIFLRDKFEVHFPSEVVVRGTIFPGVVIESHGRVYEVLEKKTAVRITFNVITGKIEEAPL